MTLMTCSADQLLPVDRTPCGGAMKRRIITTEDLEAFASLISSDSGDRDPFFDRATITPETASINTHLLEYGSNEDAVDADPRIRLIDWLDRHIFSEQCSFCGTRFLQKTVSQETDQAPAPYGHNGVGAEYISCLLCPWCGHFQFSVELTEREYDSNDPVETTFTYDAFIGRLRSFDKGLPAGATTEIAQHMRRNPKLWHLIAPQTLERLVAEILRSSIAGATVEHVGRPDDGGVDVVLVTAAGRQWLVQVKRRSREGKSEGPEVLRSLLGVVTVKNAAGGIVVSTADHFTYRAYEFAGQAAKVGKQILLADKRLLSRLIDPLIPRVGWLHLLRQQAGTALPDLVDQIEAWYSSLSQPTLFSSVAAQEPSDLWP